MRKKKQQPRETISVNVTIDAGRIYEDASNGVRSFDPEILVERLVDRGIEISDDLANAIREIGEDLGLVEWSELNDHFTGDYDLEVDLDSENVDKILDDLASCEMLLRENQRNLAACLSKEIPEIREARMGLMSEYIQYEGDQVLRECFNGHNPSSTDKWLFRELIIGAGFGTLLKGEN